MISRAATAVAADRIRHPFVTPAEREEMQAVLKREQAADPFDNRAPIQMSSVDGMGFLGVPRLGEVEEARPARRAYAEPVSVRSERLIRAAGSHAEEIPTAFEAPPAVTAEFRTAERIAPAPETDEMSRVHGWLMDEVERLEAVLVSRTVPVMAAPVPESPEDGMHGHAAKMEAAVEVVEHPHWEASGPVDLDGYPEGADRPRLGRSGVEAEPIPFAPVAEALRRSPVREDVPQHMMRGFGDPSRPECRPLPAPKPREAILADPVPPIRQQQPRGVPPVRAARSQSTIAALVLAYAVFALIPVTEWISGTFDPRVGAVVPAIAFFGWLGIHLIRRDQLFQLRVLTAWQIGHAVWSFHAIRPWGGSSAPILWTTAAFAVGCALVVVALSATIEALEYRSVRTPPARPLPPRPSMMPARRDLGVPAE